MLIEDKGGQRLKKLLADPQRAAQVAEVREGMREMDRAYEMNLALIRSAAELTQVELAKRLGVGQAAVSKIERHRDLLLSTLAGYIQAAGAQARIVVNVKGHDIEYDLTSPPPSH